MSAAVSLAKAARELGRKPATVRRWIQEGAPCARPGEPGRGKGALVVVEDLKAWRDAHGAHEVLSGRQFAVRLACLLRDYHRAGDHRLVKLTDDAAKLYLAGILEYCALRSGMDEIEVDAIELFPAKPRD